tara:strand:- start:2012 stop:2161 length:150 start_codon:yes stop_codon:yes gene_type:complete
MEAGSLKSKDMNDTTLTIVGEDENSSVVTCFNHLAISFFSHVFTVVMSE